MNNLNFIKKIRACLPPFLLLLFIFCLSGSRLFAQQQIFTGKVQDQNGNPLESVSVTVKGKPNIGTTTNAEGNFSINASQNDVIIPAFVGYQQQEIVAGVNPVPDITVRLLDTKLNQVVVIGYGTKLRGELTG